MKIKIGDGSIPANTYDPRIFCVSRICDTRSWSDSDKIIECAFNKNIIESQKKFYGGICGDCYLESVSHFNNVNNNYAIDDYVYHKTLNVE